MKSILFAAICLLGVSFHVQAQSAPKRDRIKYLFVLMKQDSLVLKQMDATINMARSVTKMGTGMAKQMVAADSVRIPVDSAMLKRHDVFMQKMIKVAKENTLKLINEDMVDIYDQYFTVQEIEAFCAFYQTPAGRKLIDTTPAISKDIMMRSMTKYQPEIMKLFKEYMDESKREIEQKYK
ncbi:DUF2059 domain-containing protein [Fibrella forsythiae]|uniref:DUF2059 domain-containing protein n=1 Tax=Fibrella forsythiae TaxID=2817061 RepID=A0ABS3JMF4_9BACT|nr:DUF2059 domain-containing protein [Fibrella forsythiae]MBO0950384.1 DUF2059 domain-containing protein [Fibrella forsythiae]